MNAVEALRTARAAGVRIGIDGDELVLEAMAPPPPAVLDLLFRHKAGIMRLLRPESWSAEQWQVCFDERAAIVEFDGTAPREWAAGFARLCVMPRPRWVPPPRWQHFLNDGGQFLDEWSGRFDALGWSALDVFGCDEHEPWARVDRLGLVWLLDGGRVVVAGPTVARIVTASGATQSYTRKIDNAGRVPAWELTCAP